MTIGIVSESSSDIRMSYAKNNDIKIVPASVDINGTIHQEDENFDIKSYYELFATQKNFLPKSFPAPSERYYEAYTKLIEADSKEIIVISLSSALSENMKNAQIAAEQILAEHDDVQIEVIDSYNASLGLVYLIESAISARTMGQSYEEVIQTVKAKVPKITNHVFVPDLKFLKAAGRVNVAKYWLAKITRKKPITSFNDKGENEVISTVTNIDDGLVELLKLVTKDNTVFPTKIAIVHTNIPERVEKLEKLLLEKIENVSIRDALAGIAVSASTGPDTIALVCEYEENQRDINF
ncbi:MAG: DegV family protein [Candidatus Kariarchaeaceae archaeon]